MSMVFLKVLNLSLTASLLILAVLPVRLLLKKAPKWTSCLLWLIVAAALVCPVRVESPMSVLPSQDIIPPSVMESGLPEVQTSPVLIQDMPVTEGVHRMMPSPPDYTDIGAAVWSAGMLVLLFAATVSYLRLRKRVAVSIPAQGNVYLCDDIDTPFILGILRPRIYLPSELDELTAQQVLTHERAHLARKDHWWKPLGYLLLTVHWFNPLVWLAYSLLCTDIELACDEKVIRDMDLPGKKVYSEALLRCSMPRHMIAACPLAFGEVGVKQRISAVLHYKKPAFWVIVIAIVLCAALCVGFLTKPAVITLADLGDVAAEEIESVRVSSDADSLTQNRQVLFERLAQLELQPEWIKTPLDGDYHTIIMTRQEGAATYQLYFSYDFTKLQLNRIVTGPDGGDQLYDSHYKVLNPQLLQTNESFSAHFDHSSADLRKITVRKDADYEFVTANDTDRICGVLQALELTPVTAKDEPAPKAYQIILETKNRDTVTLQFNKEFTRVSVTADGSTSDIYEVRNPETLQHPDFPCGVYWAEDAMHGVIEGFLQANKLNISNFEILHQMVEAYGIYAVVSFDLLNTDGSIRAADQLCLARLAAYNGEFYVIDVVSGQWSPANGFYPNYTEFDGQAVLWSSGSALGYDRFRMTYENGRSYYYAFREGAFVDILHEGRPVELVPVDDSNNAAAHLTYGADYFSSDDHSRIRINTQSGDILSITDYPVRQGADIVLPYAVYPDMDGSFIGYEALYDAIKTASSEALQKQKNIVLIGTKNLNGTDYAAIHCGDAAYLLEYAPNEDGTVTISAIGNGAVAERMGNFGYAMNYSMLSGKTLYWSTFSDKRWATTADGKETDTSKTVPTDYTGFRFIWADLHQEDYPVTGSFFLAEVDSTIPPAIAIPMAGKTLLTALGFNV